MKRSDKPYTQLGQGLDILLGSNESDNEPTTLLMEEIQLPASQPRRYFDPDKLQQLQRSIEQYGVLEPVLVRPRDDDTYELVAGERRYRAAKAAGLQEMPVVIKELTDTEALQVALIENLQREDLNPIEETLGVLQLLASLLQIEPDEVRCLLYQMKNQIEKNGKEARHNVMPNEQAQIIIEETFTTLGLMGWRSFTQNRLPLLKLPDEIVEAIQTGQLEYTKAKAIARIKDEQQRQELLETAIQESLSLSQIKERIRSLTKPSKATNHQLKERFTKTYQRLNKSSVWNDPQAQAKLEDLVTKIEALLEN